MFCQKSYLEIQKSFDKQADIFIKNRVVSIKILEKGHPTHIHRQNFERVLEYLKAKTLDTCILEYHCLRQNNRIGENIFKSNPLFHENPI